MQDVAWPRLAAVSTRAPPVVAGFDHAAMTYSAWLDKQFAKPQTLHRLYLNQATADAAAVGQQISEVFFDSWWTQALGADDQNAPATPWTPLPSLRVHRTHRLRP